MFKDQLSTQTKVLPGDYAYVYQYQKRKEIKYFSDLDLILISGIAPGKPGDPIIVSGVKSTHCGTFENNENITGILEYLKDGNKVKTNEGYKIINFFKNNKKPELCLRKIKDEYKNTYCQLFAVFQLAKGIEIHSKPYEIICLDENNLCELVTLTKITSPRLNNGFISYEVNGVNIFDSDFEVWINGINYTGQDRAQKIFEWSCKNKNDINDATFNFNKIFSMKLISYTAKNIII